MNAAELHYLDATDLARRLRAREVSAREVVQAHLERIEEVNGAVNAFVTLTADQALHDARDADEHLAGGGVVGPLHGLPIGIKDLHRTKGVRTTFGSPIHADFVPDEDDLIVERVKAAGAIVLGKTNVPEFGAGSQTFNEVFGATRNPYDLTRTVGGSSGGAAAALASGMVPLADGSDLGGSLRNPASFCNVVGLRPSPGRVPVWPRTLAWDPLSVAGPMGRTVADTTLLLSAIAGPDPKSPIALDTPGGAFSPAALAADVAGTRIAWSVDLGRYPVEKVVGEVFRAALPAFAALGCLLEEDHPDFAGADETFQVLRAWLFAQQHRDALAAHRDLFKEELVWNVEKGLALQGITVSAAEADKTELYHRLRTFFTDHDVLVLPTCQVVPFDVGQRWVHEIEGVQLETYLDWMGLCYAISLTGHPSISVPCGFTAEGLPVGLQIVGRHRGEHDVLRLAHAFEQATGTGRTRPALASALPV